MIGQAAPSPRFAIVFRGYDRNDVDSWLRRHEVQANEAEAFAEITRRERFLEEKLARLQGKPSEPLPETLAAFVLHRARELAGELPGQMVRQAEAEREEARKLAARVSESAQARSARIVEWARGDGEDAAAMAEDARRQADLFREEADQRAREQVRTRWAETTIGLAELEVELARIRARRRVVLDELDQLEQSVERSRAVLRQRGTAETEDPAGPDDDPQRLDSFEWPAGATQPVDPMEPAAEHPSAGPPFEERHGHVTGAYHLRQPRALAVGLLARRRARITGLAIADESAARPWISIGITMLALLGWRVARSQIRPGRAA